MSGSLNINLHGMIYEAFRYPAGETQVRVRPENIEAIRSADEIRIIARLRNAEDLIELALLCDAVENICDCWMSIVFPYLPYGRADRRFTDGDCFGLEVFGRFVAAMAPNRTVTLDAHSDKAMKYMPELVNVSALPFIGQAICEFASTQPNKRINVLFPDKGARDRYALPTYFGSNHGVISPTVLHASKTRDEVTGKFTGFEIPWMLTDPEWKAPTLIVDDLCDGGGTFVGLGDLIPCDIPLGLYVTHGIFSRRVNVLRPRFSWIATTNTTYETLPIAGSGIPDLIIEATPALLKAASKKTEPVLV